MTFQPELLGTRCCVIKVIYDSVEEASKFEGKVELLTVRSDSLELCKAMSSDLIEFEPKTPDEMKEYFMEHAKLFE